MAPKIRELPLSNLQKRMLFQGINKARKAINSTNLWKAQHEAERRVFEAQSEAISSNKRKRVEKNLNTIFAGIQEIMEAQRLQAEQEREKAEKQARIDYNKLANAAELSARAMRAKDYKACQIEWQIDDYMINWSLVASGVASVEMAQSWGWLIDRYSSLNVGRE